MHCFWKKAWLGDFLCDFSWSLGDFFTYTNMWQSCQTLRLRKDERMCHDPCRQKTVANQRYNASRTLCYVCTFGSSQLHFWRCGQLENSPSMFHSYRCFWDCSQSVNRDCQMVYFQTQNPNLGKFWSVCNERCWCILWPLGVYFGYSV
jgi:hypothetical protein